MPLAGKSNRTQGEEIRWLKKSAKCPPKSPPFARSVDFKVKTLIKAVTKIKHRKAEKKLCPTLMTKNEIERPKELKPLI